MTASKITSSETRFSQPLYHLGVRMPDGTPVGYIYHYQELESEQRAAIEAAMPGAIIRKALVMGSGKLVEVFVPDRLPPRRISEHSGSAAGASLPQSFGTKIVSVAVFLKPEKTDPLCPDYKAIIFSAPAPARHADVLRPLSQLHKAAVLQAEQGFLTDTGHFLTRTEAKRFVQVVGQKTIDGVHPDELFSEDLW